MESHTHASLLSRLRHSPRDQIAWRDLVRVYGPKIHAWCLSWGLQEADARDVTQEVLVKITTRIGAFAYDPARSFRAYLKTLTRYAWLDLVEDQRLAGTASGDDSSAGRRLDSIEARDDLVTRMEEVLDGELLAEAMLRVASRVEPKTWEAFRLTAVEGLSGAETAERLGMKVATVFVVKGRVLKMLQDEVRTLEGPLP